LFKIIKLKKAVSVPAKNDFLLRRQVNGTKMEFAVVKRNQLQGNIILCGWLHYFFKFNALR
jgi:hypothetical protein